MNDIVLGTCSLCGGRVTQPSVWWSVGPMPPPQCEKCGAVKKQPHGPVIDMEPPTQFDIRTTTTKTEQTK